MQSLNIKGGPDHVVKGGHVHEAIRTKFTINLQNSTFQASDDFKSDDSKTFLRQDIAKRFPDS